MSSTNRSRVRDTHIADYYITPTDEISKFLKEFNKVDSYHLKYGKILDPCAGGDINTPMSYPEALKAWNSRIDTIDIRKDSRAKLKADYLLTDCKNKYDLIITNPPFNIAIDIIEKALDNVAPGGIVVMLERLNFFGSDKRKSFWDKHLPIYSFIHHKRMSFTPNGKTDSIEYCHMVWKKGCNPLYTLQKII